MRVAQVVLGAYYGTGKKGGIMSTFLMGVYDEARKVWLTVCKVGNGHDDATLDRLADHIEKYLDCDRLLELARDPKFRTSD